MRAIFRRTIAGILAAAAFFAAAELVAVFIDPAAAPFPVIGATVIDHTPDTVREWAIQTFGRNDKRTLFGLMTVTAVSVAAAAGLVERPRRRIGSALFGILGIAAAALAVARPGGQTSFAVPALVGVVAGVAVLRLLTDRADVTAPDGRAIGRREFLWFAVGAGAAAALAGIGGRMLGAASRAVDASRAALRLPTPASPARPIPDGADLHIPGLSSYLTPNADFYRIDTALTVAHVTPDDWSLRVHGMVDREVVLSWAELTARPAIERTVTLTCVSNPVGGDLIGTATWLGFPLADILAEARPHPDADMVLSRSADNFTAGSPLTALTDGRDALVAIGMNGEPLPVEHGFPARLVVPGLYGYVSATKWVTDLEVTRFDRAQAYWTVRGWSEQGPIKTGTRIDTPQPGAGLTAGRIVVAGVAWAQHRGIRAVQVQVDDGDWQPTRLAVDHSVDTWRQWAFDWDATPGRHTIRARATDDNGAVQTADRADVVPDGATGYPEVSVRVG